MRNKLKKLKYKYWDEYNPEGIRGKDAFFMFWFVILGFLFFTNLTFWLANPDQSWIGDILFPFK